MTNTGGRAQKHYQGNYLVLTDPTHAIPIIFLLLLSSKQAQSFDIEGTEGSFGTYLLMLVPTKIFI